MKTTVSEFLFLLQNVSSKMAHMHKKLSTIYPFPVRSANLHFVYFGGQWINEKLLLQENSNSSKPTTDQNEYDKGRAGDYRTDKGPLPWKLVCLVRVTFTQQDTVGNPSAPTALESDLRRILGVTHIRHQFAPRSRFWLDSHAHCCEQLA